MKWFLLIFLLIAALSSYSQTYVSLAPSITNSAGRFVEKSNLAIELGQQWDVFSLGIDIGKTTLGSTGAKDTSAYLEIRPNLNVFQQGKFTNTFTAGIGYVFNARENLLTELTNGIEYAFNNRIHFNVVFGQYFYSGRYSASDVTFFGFSGIFYFNQTTTGSLIKKQKD